MIYSNVKIKSLLLFMFTYYTTFIYNITFYININLQNFSHTEMIREGFISSQKLLFNMSVFIVILLIGFGNKYKNIFRLIRINTYKSLVVSVLKKGVLISVFFACNAVAVQVVLLALNNLKIDYQALFLTFSVISMYAYSFYSLYT